MITRRTFVAQGSAMGTAITLLPGLARAAPPRAGTLVELGEVPSAFVARRAVTVWLPEGYAGGRARYPVIYMHDGQNLFDDARASFGVSWGIADHIAALVTSGRSRAAIVVGLWNTPRRFQEYGPAGILGELPEPVRNRIETGYGGPALSDRYLRFIVEELKPMIDGTYRTLPGRTDTSIMGSSMGGLISLAALCAYPQIFGGAGCLSTHLPLIPIDPARDAAVVDDVRAPVEAALRRFIARALPRAGSHRLYMDHGTEHLDQYYAPFQAVVDRAILARGYHAGRDFISRAFPGTSHNERAWNDRVEMPLQFLLRTGPVRAQRLQAQ
jgi:enterochelin esterase-like enzyme